MLAEEESIDAASQLQMSFQNLSQYFKKDGQPHKAAKRAHPEPATNENKDPGHMMKLLALLALRQEQEIQSIRAQDTFILRLTQEPDGLLQILAESGQRCGQQEPKTMPLRVHLFKTMADEIQKRFEMVMKADPSSPMFQELQKKQFILADGSWPTLQWHHDTQKYVISSPPISMKAMQQLVTELQEIPTQHFLIARFFCMKPAGNNRLSAAWRLQMNLRHDGAYEVMWKLSNSTLWFLVGAIMKIHQPGPSSLCQEISAFLGKGKGRGKGKGKPSKKS